MPIKERSIRPIQRDAPSVRAFFQRHGLMGREANERSILLGEELGPRLVHQIRGTLADANATHEEQGKGVVFLFPLTGAAAHYEFFRGILEVLAPRAKARMVLTPKSKQIDFLENKVPDLLANQLEEIRKLRPHKVVVVDSSGIGNTFRYLREKLLDPFEKDSIKSSDIHSEGQLFDDVSEHFLQFDIQPGTLSRKWWDKGYSGLNLQYKAKNFERRSEFAKERLYFYRLGRVYARAYLQNTTKFQEAP